MKHENHTGICYLVGAGPGDYHLLTLRGEELLERADTVVYDRLADARILEFAPAGAEKIYVGKEAGRHTLPQEEINRILVDRASAGKTVVRLKGGDPFVFGRGGEEIRALRAAGIPFEEVPGVTSAIAAAAYAGIPVTDRERASSFAVVTGHGADGKSRPAPDLGALGRAADTLVVLMGVRRIGQIADEIMAGGRSADTPAAIVERGTKADQRTVPTTLGRAAEDAEAAGVRPPAIFVVGSVAEFREDLRWFDMRPLYGKTIVVTRMKPQAEWITDRLEELGAKVIGLPLIRIEDPTDGWAGLDQAIRHIAEYRWVCFTSANGVRAFFRRLDQLGLDVRALGGAKVAAIGSATAAALKKTARIRADLVPDEYRAEGLLDALGQVIERGDRVLIPRAKEARSILPETLEKLGARPDVREAYQTLPAEENGRRLRKILEAGRADMITFTSSSTVRSLKNLLGGDISLLKNGPEMAYIGPVTAEEAAKQGLPDGITADVFTADGLVRKITEHYGSVKEAKEEEE